MTESTTKTNGVTARRVLAACLLYPYVPLVFSYMAAPGFIIPFLNNPIARIILAILVFWNLIGIYWLLKYDVRSIILRAFILLLFGLPLLLAPMLGPVFITIIMALHGAL